jgi:hypothetical protein
MIYTGQSKNESIKRDIIGLILRTPGTTQTPVAAKTLAGWTTIFAPATLPAIAGVYVDTSWGFENKTKADEYVESNVGISVRTNQFAPDFHVFAKMTEEDYEATKYLDGKKMDISLQRNDGKIETGLFGALEKGFSGTIYFESPMTIPGGAEKIKAYPIHVVLDYWDEWNAKLLVQPAISIAQFKNICPIGYELELVTAYETGGKTVVVKVTERGSKTSQNPNGTPVVILTTTSEWALLSYGDTGGAISVVGATLANQGIYTLTVINTAAAMTAPFVIQGYKVVTGAVAYVTNPLTIVTP